MPGIADSNSPVFWRDGELRILNSTGLPLLSSGLNQFYFWNTEAVSADPPDHSPMWIESVWVDEDGTVYGWYHHEPAGVCPQSELTAPRIGAVVSDDGGTTFRDLGIVLESGDAPDCSAKNGYFAGGHGDFSVIPDRGHQYFYFLFGNYGGDAAGQGVAIARMAFEDRFSPAGKVSKYHEGAWTEPGLGGRVTPVFPAKAAWQRADTDSFWGPSIHWNTYLEKYVVLMSRSCCAPKWPDAGTYITYNQDLSDPAGFTQPEKILEDVGFHPAWYPQVIGLGPNETDTLAGQTARLYVKGVSKWEIVFQ